MQRILGSHESLAEKLRLVWPRLADLSCWADGASSTLLPLTRCVLPHVAVQPKGLVSTEAFVSIPLTGQSGAALAIRSHFFEFMEVSSRRCRLAHELERDGRYEVVVTTAGGLYRYRLYDKVIVTGYLNNCPLLRFVGRTNRGSDLVGKSLASRMWARLFLASLRDLGVVPVFAMLVPVMGARPHYVALPGSEGTGRPRLAIGWPRVWSRGLRENPPAYELAVPSATSHAREMTSSERAPIYSADFTRNVVSRKESNPAISNPWSWGVRRTGVNSIEPAATNNCSYHVLAYSSN